MFKIPDGYEKFCEPTPFCEANDPEIKKLAEEITKNKNTPEEASKAIFEWVRDKVRWDILPTVGAKKLLKRKPIAGICTDKVNLFIALCRAIGIPARYLFIYCDLKTILKELPKRVGHAAAEVFINGEWIISDPTFGENEETLFHPNKFGEPSWESAREIIRLRSLSRFIVFIDNFIVTTRMLATSRKFKEALNKFRDKK
ncbi:MAG: transglutaminase family protein [Candidatus Parvarchaeota archaeon]|nr:transglutaminase family protein [Candidatus Jingweiarchaeum tengchongense]MCW1298676.1 transglutaminase family protein [Candidatus Jingweiarchaeum tengchongense]MCW1300518.1 transglutaminase family protein [Candidatus Jingweiarchaeum tengchongense]MCW1304667.1 transglutaminase family protein [Candidatus Jingweiarchaeum tengchongense]MCW1305856.1 transglutaminase family protein [Candidatus Jingweiarchaeum tengchongense]